MLDAYHVSYRIGRKCLLNDVSLSVQPGQFVAIAGANGAGKSTLLKLLSREILPSSGHISMNGILLNHYTAHALARQRAVLTQHNPIAFNFRVHELVMMGRYPHFTGQPTADDIAIVNRAQQLTGITHLTNRVLPTLSGGEQQRTHLAKVLAQLMSPQNNPSAQPANRYLLLDEPNSGLDIHYQYSLLNLARDLTRQQYGVVMILHDLNVILQYADKVLLLKEGHPLAFGEPSSILTPEAVQEAFQLTVSRVYQPESDQLFLMPIRQSC